MPSREESANEPSEERATLTKAQELRVVHPRREWQSSLSVSPSFASLRLRVLDWRHLNAPVPIGDGHCSAAILTQPKIIASPLVGQCSVGRLEWYFDNEQFTFVQIEQSGFTGRIGAFPDHFGLPVTHIGLYVLLSEVRVSEQAPLRWPVGVLNAPILIESPTSRGRRLDRRPVCAATTGSGRSRGIGSDGIVSLAALRWLADQVAAFIMLERDGTALTTTGPVRPSDARLRRGQALALSMVSELLCSSLEKPILCVKILWCDSVPRERDFRHRRSRRQRIQ